MVPLKTNVGAPKLENGEVACLRIDPNTGVPVDKEGNWLTKDLIEYLVFDNFESAKHFVEREVTDRQKALEYSIIDDEGEQIWVSRPDPPELPPRPKAGIFEFLRRILGN